MTGASKRRDHRIGASFRRTFGFQFLAADFTDLREAGRYTLEARLATSGGVRVLRSRPFEISSRFVTERMLWPLSILNAKARRAAEEDFRRNWFIDSGHAAWSVGLDGAFVADRADDQGGAVLRRIFNTFNSPLSADNFRFVARITIVAGCDAQLQFWITDDERWAVTLQAGDAGGCSHGAGPGAVRLHRERPVVLERNHFEAVGRTDGRRAVQSRTCVRRGGARTGQASSRCCSTASSVIDRWRADGPASRRARSR